MAQRYDTLLYDVQEGVCTITLNRPEVFNAFNEALTSDLGAALDACAIDEGVRAVVITGAGKAFCAGQDLKDLQTQYAGGEIAYLGPRLRRDYNPVILRMRNLEKPVIAAVNGVAAGAGCSLALAADLRIMGAGATLIEVFINVGLVPDCGSTLTLPRLVGMGKALELCFTGDRVTAEEAHRLGLANEVAPDGQLMEAANKLAGRLARMPTRAIGLTKRLINQSFDHTLEQQLEAEARMQETADKTADHVEGICAFLEKRKPSFQGR
ncbi:MAG TPA: enoyl-CoA hydratase-related protein [Phycisphaerae bacterium]|nr:enoyl-CoA hydratase-related protein [Phycisphaerae bacterium]